MRPSHRRVLFLLLSLFGMALASAAHAGSICAADGSRSVGSLLCDYASATALPAGVDSRTVYDRPADELESLAASHGSDDGIVLPGQDFIAETAPASGLLLGRAWIGSQDVASADWR